MFFDDQGARKLDENISTLVLKIKNLIKLSELKLRQMQSSDSEISSQESFAKKEIIKNVQQSYIAKL